MMATLTVEDVVRGTQGALVGGDLGVPVRGVSIDSRTLTVGEVFFAIRGHQLDGHAYLGDVAARGASCVVVHALPDDLPASVPAVLVDDTTRALGRFAAHHRARFTLPVPAATGSGSRARWWAAKRPSARVVSSTSTAGTEAGRSSGSA